MTPNNKTKVSDTELELVRGCRKCKDRADVLLKDYVNQGYTCVSCFTAGIILETEKIMVEDKDATSTNQDT